MRFFKHILIQLVLLAIVYGCGRSLPQRLADLNPRAANPRSDDSDSPTAADTDAEAEQETEAEEGGDDGGDDGSEAETESEERDPEAGDAEEEDNRTDPVIPHAESFVVSGIYAPVETFFAEISEIPLRLRSQSLRLRLRSNIEGASFECRFSPRGEWLKDCFRGDELVINGLSDRNVYRIELRAVSPDGFPDATPIKVSFMVDLRFGLPLTPDAGRAALAALVPASPADLPGFRSTPNKPGNVASAVALGRHLAYVVPYGHRVSAYATDLTYNGRLKLFLAMEPASLIDAPSCNRSWERLVNGPDGMKFCDATPHSTDLQASYRRPIPRNHIETFNGPPGNPDEKLYVAAFQDQPGDPDAAEARLDLNAYCPKEARRGSVPAALLKQKLGGHLRDQLNWCMIQGTDSTWWWIGHFKLNLTQDRGRLAGVYAVRAKSLSVQNSQEFIRRTIDVLSKVLVPLGVSP